MELQEGRLQVLPPVRVLERQNVVLSEVKLVQFCLGLVELGLTYCRVYAD